MNMRIFPQKQNGKCNCMVEWLLPTLFQKEFAMDKAAIDSAHQALAEMKNKGLPVKSPRPFLLARVAELTGGA